MGVWASACRLPGDLYKNFIGLDHTQFAAGFFFHHLKTFLQVTHLGGELVVTDLGLRIFGSLLVEPALQVAHIGYAAPTHPKLRMEDHQQQNQNSGNDAGLHGKLLQQGSAGVIKAGQVDARVA